MATTDKCSKSVRCSKIKVAEKGKSAIIVNENRERYSTIKVDGCLVENEMAADWVISKKDVGDVIIELKGVNIDHATEQVLRTARILTESGMFKSKLAGLIVGQRYPKFDTKVQRAEREFAKLTKGPLHVVCRNREYLFDEIFEFKSLA